MKMMGIDLGQARTGVCVSDLSGFLAGRSITIPEHNRQRLLAAICREIEAEKPERIVLGLPLNMNGTEGPKAAECRAFAAQLQEACGLQQRHRQPHFERRREKTGQAAGAGRRRGGTGDPAGLSGLLQFA